MTVVGVDTSVAIPLLVATHEAHASVVSWWDGRELALSGHSLAETYSVLTRLPGDLRVTPGDAARLIARRFTSPLTMHAKTFTTLPALLARHQIAGGAVYDALVALAAVDREAQLATRDLRAQSTYEALGADVTIVR